MKEPGSEARAIQRLRRLGVAEGISFLVLLGIAMPLKYWLGFPLAVKIVGWAHGILLILFALALAQAKKEARWSFTYAGVIFLAALVPFGPFMIDRRLQREPAA